MASNVDGSNLTNITEILKETYGDSVNHLQPVREIGEKAGWTWL